MALASTVAMLVVAAVAVDVKRYESASQVTNVAHSGGNTTTTRFLGTFDAVEGCEKACLALDGERCWSYTFYTKGHPDGDLSSQCFGLVAPRFTPTPENFTVTGVVQWPCRGDGDCSLNGACQEDSGSCLCDPAWSGHRCETLNLEPAVHGAGYRGVDGGHNTSSWGGAVLQGEDGLYHMWAAEMTEHCGIGAWSQNSRIIRATATTPGGEYTRAQVVYDVFSHEPEVVRGPDGEYVMFYTADIRSKHGDCDCCQPGVSQCDGSTGPKDCPQGANLTLRNDDASWMSYALRPEGPWSEPQQLFPGYHGSDTNFAPVILPNGTILGIWRDWDQDLGSRCFVAVGDYWNDTTTYTQYHKELFPDLGAAGTEDPFLWVDPRGNFHAIFHHMYGYGSEDEWWLLALGGHAFSENGMDWTYSGVAWGDPFDLERGDLVHYRDGETFRMTRRERPHLVLDSKGNPTHLINAAQYGTGKIPTEVGDNGDASFTMIQKIVQK